MDILLIHTLNSLFYASILFLIACGLTLVYGVMRIVNMAHGNLYAFGAYTAAWAIGLVTSYLHASLLFILLIANAAISIQNTLNIFRISARVAYSYRVLRALETTLATLVDAETSQRGYLIGDEAYLEPYLAAMTVIDERLHDLKDLAAEDETFPHGIDLLEQRIERSEAAHAVVVVHAARLEELAAFAGRMPVGADLSFAVSPAVGMWVALGGAALLLAAGLASREP